MKKSRSVGLNYGRDGIELVEFMEFIEFVGALRQIPNGVAFLCHPGIARKERKLEGAREVN